MTCLRTTVFALSRCSRTRLPLQSHRRSLFSLPDFNPSSLFSEPEEQKYSERKIFPYVSGHHSSGISWL